MSVRPLTHSEELLAWGNPWSNWLALFGASQGILLHLNFNGRRITQTWMPTAASRVTLPIFLIGGAAAGAFFGVQAFGDAELRRLHHSHAQDLRLDTANKIYRPQQL